MIQGQRVRSIGIGLFGSLGIFFGPARLHAQVLPDPTLGTLVNGSDTLTCTGLCEITNGTQRGRNLFHSFQQFSLPNGDIAAFITNPAIHNILVRVTGTSNSTINGIILTTDPTFTSIIPTNFFLLNPNGVVFGPNARILTNGAFLATTADRITFPDDTIFSARDQTVNPLLTINLPVGLQMGQTPGSIQVQPNTPLNNDPGNSQFSRLTLVGGDITVDNAILAAPGQRIELAALASAESVELRQSGNLFQLGTVSGTTRADITLVNRAGLQAIAPSGGGDIVVYGRNVRLTDASYFSTGNLSGLGTSENRVGSIVVEATGTLQLLNGSQINNVVLGIGNSGSIRLAGQRVELGNGSIIGSASLGSGDAGAVEIQAAESITLFGTNANGTASGVLSSVGSVLGFSGTGNGGNLFLKSPNIQLRDGAQVATTTILAQGNAGNIRVEVENQLSLTNGSGIQASTSGTGNAGNIQIDANQFTLMNGSGIQASTSGTGNAGNIQVEAQTIVLDGFNPNNLNVSNISSDVRNTATGKGGEVTLKTDTLSVTNGAFVSASTSGNGRAGNVRVNARNIHLDGESSTAAVVSGISSAVVGGATGQGGDVTIATETLTITNGARITASTSGNGDAGNVQINARAIILDGNDPGATAVSGIASGVEQFANGQGGDVDINTETLTITNGARITASTFGNGSAGDVFVNARNILVDGTTTNDAFVSGIASTVEATAIGNGGNINLTADRLTLTNGARITASTAGNGSAGSIQVVAETIAIRGAGRNELFKSSIVSQVEPSGTGTGGNLSLATRDLRLSDGGFVAVSSFGNGNAGNITIAANLIDLIGNRQNETSNTSIASQIGFTGRGTGGNVTLRTTTLNILDGAFISASTFGNGNAGNIDITARRIGLDGTTANGVNGSNIVSAVELTAIGNGGNVKLTTADLSLTNGAFISANTSGNGNAGDVQIVANQINIDGTGPNTIFPGGISTASRSLSRAGNINITASQLRLNNRGLITTTSAAADGGNITLNVSDLLLMRRGSEISATAGIAQLGGNGGNITINAPRGFLVSAPNENNDITANAFRGTGGKIEINAQGIYWFTPRSQAELRQVLGTPPFNPSRLLTNDITASSELGISGTVTLSTPNVDPSRGLTQLPQNLIDTNRLLANSCIVRDRASGGTFLITGTGGLPEQPGTGMPRFAVGDVRGLEETGKMRSPHAQPNLPPRTAITEAEGIYQLPDGQLILSLECQPFR